MFTLAISCLPTSNLPRFMDLTFQVAMEYWFLQHWTLLPSLVTSLTGFVCFFFFFALALSLHCFWSYFSTISSSILGTYQPGEFIFQHPIFLPSYCSLCSQGKNTEVVCHSLPQWITFCQNSPPCPICLGCPCMA